MRKPCIFIVDDNDGFRESVAFMLGQSRYSIEQFSNAQAVLDTLESLSAQDRVCLLLDVRMPGLSGLDLHDRVSVARADMPVIYMTGHADVPLAVEAMKKGAVTLLEKPLNPEALLQAVEGAFDRATTDTLHAVPVISSGEVEDRRQAACTEVQSDYSAMEERLATLTPREAEVLEYLVKGMANKQCAYELDISVRTVELHRARLLKKLRVRSGAELIRSILIHRAYQ